MPLPADHHQGPRTGTPLPGLATQGLGTHQTHQLRRSCGSTSYDRKSLILPGVSPFLLVVIDTSVTTSIAHKRVVKVAKQVASSTISAKAHYSSRRCHNSLITAPEPMAAKPSRVRDSCPDSANNGSHRRCLVSERCAPARLQQLRGAQRYLLTRQRAARRGRHHHVACRRFTIQWVSPRAQGGCCGGPRGRVATVASALADGSGVQEAALSGRCAHHVLRCRRSNDH